MVDFLLTLLPHLLNGIALGQLFALLSLGFMLIIGVMEVINLAHGSLFALSAYFAVMLMSQDGGITRPAMAAYFDLPIVLRYVIALIVAPALVAVVGMGLEIC